MWLLETNGVASIVVGGYKPGKQLVISPYSHLSAHTVHSHERYHLTIADSSTVGRYLECLGGIHSPEQAAHAQSHMRDIVEQCWVTQEGCATACQLEECRLRGLDADLLVLQKVLPKTYRLAASWFTIDRERVKQRLRFVSHWFPEGADPDVVVNLGAIHALLVIAVAAMSIPLRDQILASSGLPSAQVLGQIRRHSPDGRLRMLCSIDLSMHWLDASRALFRSFPEWVTSGKSISSDLALLDLAAKLCKEANLPFESARDFPNDEEVSQRIGRKVTFVDGSNVLRQQFNFSLREVAMTSLAVNQVPSEDFYEAYHTQQAWADASDQAICVCELVSLAGPQANANKMVRVDIYTFVPASNAMSTYRRAGLDAEQEKTVELIHEKLLELGQEAVVALQVHSFELLVDKVLDLPTMFIHEKWIWLTRHDICKEQYDFPTIEELSRVGPVYFPGRVSEHFLDGKSYQVISSRFTPVIHPSNSGAFLPLPPLSCVTLGVAETVSVVGLGLAHDEQDFESCEPPRADLCALAHALFWGLSGYLVAADAADR